MIKFKSLVKYLLLGLLIFGAYYLSETILRVWLQYRGTDLDSISLFKSVNSIHYVRLFIIFVVFDLVLSSIYSYYRFGNIFKIILLVGMFYLAINLLIVDPKTRMVYDGFSSMGQVVLIIVPLPFLYIELADLLNFKTNGKIMLVFVILISLVLYLIYSYTIGGYHLEGLLMFLLVGFISVVATYIYLFTKIQIIGDRLLKKVKKSIDKYGDKI